MDVTRDEFNRAIEILNRRSAIIEEQAAMIAQLHHDSDVQFKRIAQIQQELDTLKKIVDKLPFALIRS